MIAAIENAMLARLDAAGEAGVLGYRYLTLQSFPQEFDKILQAAQTRYPAAWAVFSGVNGAERQGGQWNLTASFGLVVAAENLRNEAARRHGGSPTEPGAYQLALDALALLGAHKLGLSIKALEPGSIQPVNVQDIPNARHLAIYAVAFTTQFTVDALGPDLTALTTFHGDWDVPAFGGVGPTLPNEAGADASDTITFEDPE